MFNFRRLSIIFRQGTMAVTLTDRLSPETTVYLLQPANANAKALTPNGLVFTACDAARAAGDIDHLICGPLKLNYGSRMQFRLQFAIRWIVSRFMCRPFRVT